MTALHNTGAGSSRPGARAGARCAGSPALDRDMARRLAATAMAANGPVDWSRLCDALKSPSEVEAFRLALVLQGRDSASARRAIYRRMWLLGVKG